jgi:hypothetical protein
MGHRIQRRGILRSLGARLVHRYSDDGRTCTGAFHAVGLSVEVADGPDKGRWVNITLTPEEAKGWRDSLDRAIGLAESENIRSGAITITLEDDVLR